MSSVDSLFDALREIQANKSLPPVQQWRPNRVGTIDIRIASDGTWYHEGGPIRRRALVELFSSVLRKDPDGYCLVTPAEKLTIEVDDAPFVAVDLEVKGEGEDQQLLFTTNVGDHVVADAEHPIWVEGLSDTPRPYLHVRDGLYALISRSVYYRLADLCSSGEDGYRVLSSGASFTLGR